MLIFLLASYILIVSMKYKLFVWLLLFCISSTGAILVNKYVLWKLKFTYPTIFQSWQMMFAAFQLFSLHFLGYLESPKLSYETLNVWLPAVVLFSVSIYSGSVGLAGLPIPIFCLIQQSAIHCFAQIWAIYQKKNVLSQSKLALLASILCLLATLISDDIASKLKIYKWIFLHCSSNCCYSYYAATYNSVKLKEHDKLMVNSSLSILVLISFGLFTGETKIVFDFPFLYHQKFLIACVFSGTFSAVVMTSYVKLCEQLSLEMVRCYNTMFIFFVTFLSFLVFGNNLTAAQVFVIFVGLSSTLYLAFCISKAKDIKRLQDEESVNKTDTAIV